MNMEARFAKAADPAPADGTIYRGFLSYSHRDRRWAAWLHGALEAYRLPTALAGRTDARGERVPARLQPIFHDRAELAAAEDLGGRIRDALRRSRCLLVLCSPAAAASPWVDREIATFKRLHPNGCVLAAIVGGEPHASDLSGREGEECFPPSLRRRFDDRGEPTVERAEPIAADFRAHGDGRRLGLLKLVAGMTGVGLDELVGREARRRQRRLTAVAAAALAGMGVTSGLALAATQARTEAERQRAQAEGLVGFMLGDLRGELEPMGRLDALDKVGGRALAYYRAQEEGELSDDALAQRSRALTLIGEIANLRGDLDGALRRYREALAGTAEALRRAPDDPQRVFDHAQNEFWVGYIAWQRGELDEAERRFGAYKRLAERMIVLEPGKAQWRLEEVYADTNLGTLLMQRGEYGRADELFAAALREAERLAIVAPEERLYADQHAEALANSADARETLGALDDALALRERQIALLARREAANGGDASTKRSAMTAHRAHGRLLAARGETERALAELSKATALADALRALEPDNTEWLERGAKSHTDRAWLLLALERYAEGERAAASGCAAARDLADRDASVVAWRQKAWRECLHLRAEILGLAGRREDALRVARAALAVAGPVAADDSRTTTAQLWLLIGDQLVADRARAEQAWRRGVTALAPTAANPERLLVHFRLARRLGDEDEAARLTKRLSGIGYRDARFRRAQRSWSG